MRARGIRLPGTLGATGWATPPVQPQNRNWDEAHAFCKECAKRGVPMEIFGAADNARNFKTWQFALPPSDCEPSYKHIEYAADLRLPLHLTESDVHTICDVIEFSLKVTS